MRKGPLFAPDVRQVLANITDMQTTPLHLVCPPAPASQAHFEEEAIARLTRTTYAPRCISREGERANALFPPERRRGSSSIAQHSRPPFCFCNGARNFSDISRGGTEEEQKSVTVHYAVIIFLLPLSPLLTPSAPLATAKRTFGKQTNATSVCRHSVSVSPSLPRVFPAY